MRKARVDRNQREIVLALRKCGFNVVHLHGVGKGVPDLLVCDSIKYWLVEIKVATNKKGGVKYTPAQIEFHKMWKGPPIITAVSIEDVLIKLK